MTQKSKPYIDTLDKYAALNEKTSIKDLLKPVIQDVEFEDTKHIQDEELRFVVAKWNGEKSNSSRERTYRTVCVFNTKSELVLHNTGSVKYRSIRSGRIEMRENKPYCDLNELVTETVKLVPERTESKGFDDINN